ncbi:uncharacterized protein LOC114529293 [Dendronephthya gigantea]|uniref:uncharacterized protein LOC114529293 n=1 Tax=Dendronephthya gigantea TaxID=151771 RepID=UPI00106B9F47|nr:uncharacterized protein LOC114529293 [Dendronephthya gigantea]
MVIMTGVFIWMVFGGIFAGFKPVFTASCCENSGCAREANSAMTSSRKESCNLYKGYCVSKCPIGYYSKDNKCSSCHSPCSSCSKDRCLSCKDSKFLSKHGICGPDCPQDAKLAKNSSSPRVRLVAGRSSLEGVVEVYHDGVWGTICADGWTDSNADVICKELNLGAVMESKIIHEDRFTRNDSYREDRIWLSAVQCRGTESSIFNCDHAEWGENSCSHLEDVGIRCSGPDSSRRCVTSCGDGYFASKGKCFECPLDCKTCTSFDKCFSCNERRFLEGDSCVAKCEPGTFGDSKTLTCKQCPYECKTCNETAQGPTCTSCNSDKQEMFLYGGECVNQCPEGVGYVKYLRLSGNYSSPYMGVLQMIYAGVWRSVCDYYFSRNTARVFCRELGYGEPISFTFTAITRYIGAPLNLYCYGDERSFTDCYQSDWFHSWCSNRYGIQLSCQPPGNPHKVPENKCLKQCPDGTFHNKQNHCGLCNRKCLTCANGPENCLKCRKPRFLLGTTCVRTCPDGTYPNTTVRACLPCNKECMTCDGRPDVCLSCVPPLVQKGSYCGKKCPGGTYQKEYTCVENCGLWHYHGKDKMCHTCPPNCIMCSSDGKCKACKNGLVFTKDGKCNTSCPRGQYSTPVEPASVGIDMKLRLRSVEGLKYKGRLEIKHQGVWGSICDDGWSYKNALVACRQLLLGPPVQTVYLRYESFKKLNISTIWLDQVYCKEIKDSLDECERLPWGHHDCSHYEDVHIECSPPGVSRCDVECPPAYFTHGSSCLPCSSNCLNCTSANKCSLCKEGSFLANDSSCVKKCPPGFYANDKKHCKACHSSCWTCNGKLETQCTSCKPPKLLLNDNVCVSSCPKGYYKKGVNPTTELQWKVGPYEGVVMTTRKGRRGLVCDYHLNIETGNVVCKELDMGKAEEVYAKPMYSYHSIPVVLKYPYCIGTESLISQCRRLSYYYCSRGSILAVKCSGPDLSRVCINRCPTQSNFYITDKNSCEHCSENCLRCEKNATNCTACAQGLLLTWDNKCVSYCPEGTFFKAGRCEKCDDECLACHQNKQNCIVCADGKYAFEGGNCYDDCHGVGYRRKGSPFVRLSPYPDWLRPKSNASRGVVEMFVDDNWFPVCGINWDLRTAALACRDLGYGDPIKVYSWGYYLDSYMPIDHLKVLNCSGEEKTLRDCLTIGSCDYYRFAAVFCSRATPKKECVKIKNPLDCGAGFFVNNTKRECLACSSDCVTCSGTASHCTSCNYTHVLHGSKCLEECPDGYYIDLEVKTCKRCSDRCKTCLDGVSNDKCSSCNKPYFLRDTSCVDTCYPDRTLKDLEQGQESSRRVRLMNGSNPEEGFLQFKMDDGEWVDVCYARFYALNLACQELGFQSGLRVEHKYGDNPPKVVSASCDFYHGYVKDCSIEENNWCNSRSFIVCSSKPLDKRVCRKENPVPCSATACSYQAPCVNGDDTVIPKGHSYCRSCGQDSYGDGDNCTAISKFVPSVSDPYRERVIIHGKHKTYFYCYDRFAHANRYSWYKDGEQLDLSDHSYYGSVALSFVHFRDAGIYTCVLRTSVGSATVTYNVTVKGPPIIESASDIVEILVGDSVILECDVFAHPPANITWAFNNITLNENNTRDGGARVLVNRSLWINQSIAEDAGNYSCIAKNSFGRTVRIIRLRVGEELRFEKRANTVVVSKGGSATLTCLPHESDSSWSIIWRRDGKTLKTDGRYKVLDGSLTIYNVNSESCGEYYCVAKDASSIITSVGTVVIKDDPPCIHTRPQNLHLEDGMFARFYCAASGEPTPQIFWQNETKASNVFEIKKVDISHVGVYKCSARSGDKFNEAFAFLSVNDYHACPYIFKKPKSTSATFGEKATFYCDGVAESSVTIVWYRNGNRIISGGGKYTIENDGRKLTVDNVNEDDLGGYICIVSDENNHASAKAFLSSLHVGALKDNSRSSSNTAGIIIGVLSCILVILTVLFFLHRYCRHGSTPVDVINDVRRKTMSRFQSLNSHTVMHYDTSALVDDSDDEERCDANVANPFARDQ